MEQMSSVFPTEQSNPQASNLRKNTLVGISQVCQVCDEQVTSLLFKNTRGDDDIGVVVLLNEGTAYPRRYSFRRHNAKPQGKKAPPRRNYPAKKI